MRKAFIVFLTGSFFWFAAPARPARADGIGTVVIGAVLGVVALGVVSAVATSQRDVAKIDADKRVRLEEIRSQTLLEAPCRFGEKGGATYKSTEGEARIDSVIAEGTPCASPKPQISAQPVPGSGYGRPSCKRGDWELRQTSGGARWVCSSTGEML